MARMIEDRAKRKAQAVSSPCRRTDPDLQLVEGDLLRFANVLVPVLMVSW